MGDNGGQKRAFDSIGGGGSGSGPKGGATHTWKRSKSQGTQERSFNQQGRGDDQDRRSNGNWKGKGKGKGQGSTGSRSTTTSVSGPGIFVACTRGKERKAAWELIDILEEIAERLYPGVTLEEKRTERATQVVEDDDDDLDALRNGIPASSTAADKAVTTGPSKSTASIEDQIAAELAELQGDRCVKQHASHPGALNGKPRQRKPFVPAFMDMECTTFISVARPIDPKAMTYALLDEVRQTGRARSHHVQRLTPVYDTTRAELPYIVDLAERIFREKLDIPNAPPQTYKVETRVRMNGHLAKMDVIRSVAMRLAALTRSTGPAISSQEENATDELHEKTNGTDDKSATAEKNPSSPDNSASSATLSRLRADLDAPDIIVHVEVYKTVAAVGLLHDVMTYRKLNPLMLAQMVQEGQGMQEKIS